MNQPTHEEIAHKAYQLWQERGSLHGSDTEIWLEAEQMLKNQEAAPARGDTPVTATASTNTVVKAPLSPAPAIPEQEKVLSELQKSAARAPKVPHHTGPKPKPAETGKPIWPQPHSN